MKKRDEIILNIIGIIPLVIGILAVLNSLYTQNPTQILWMCYISLIIIGIGILARNSFLIMSQLYIITIPLIMWNIDFFYHLFFHSSLWGIANYFFVEKTLNLGKIISLQHIFTIPLSIYAVSKIKLKRTDAWKWSFAQIFVVYAIISIFFPPEANINCVFAPCGDFNFAGINYRIVWFAAVFGMTSITTLTLNYFLKRKSKKSKS
jgi:hypothetical protein